MKRTICVSTLLFLLVILAPRTVCAQQGPYDAFGTTPHDREVLKEAEVKLASGELKVAPYDSQKAEKDSEENLRKNSAYILPTPPYLQKLFDTLTPGLLSPDSTDGPRRFRLVYLGAKSGEWAFSYSDGTVVITENDVHDAADEAELIGLVGHEITHVVQKHGRERDAVYEYLTSHGVAHFTASKLIYNAFNPDSFERYIQMRADRGAVEMLIKFGYDPYALYSYYKRAGIDGQYLRQHQTLLEGLKCGGKKFSIGTQAEFEAMKIGVVR